jgi:hypothetical protein
MYIGYLNDRKELGFSCIKDIGGIKQLSNLKSTLKNPVSWIIRKGKQTVVLIFSKEVLVAVLIFVESISGNINQMCTIYHFHRLKYINLPSVNRPTLDF